MGGEVRLGRGPHVLSETLLGDLDSEWLKEHRSPVRSLHGVHFDNPFVFVRNCFFPCFCVTFPRSDAAVSVNIITPCLKPFVT